jgi:hypothetical protein
MSSTVLASVFVACEQESVCYLAAETARDPDESYESDDQGGRVTRRFRSVESRLIDFERLCLTIDDEPESPPYRQDRKWLKRGIQCETTHIVGDLLMLPRQSGSQ